MLTELNDRSREILRLVVEAFVDTGAPVGSRTLSRQLSEGVSPATIRNVLADLEELGLLYAPHVSAGRLPTDAGLRLFVDGLLEVGNLSQDEQEMIRAQCTGNGRSIDKVLEEASTMMSGLSRCAGLVMAPKTESKLKHIEFVSLGPGRALVVMVTEEGLVENRVVDLPPGVSPSILVEAGNFLAAKLVGRSLGDARDEISKEIEANRQAIDALSAKVVEAGLATWSDSSGNGVLIVRGQANLLNDVSGKADLENIRALFNALETKENLMRLLDLTQGADGVQIFVGAENDLFSLTGCSLIISPYKNSKQQIVGAIGVVGPTRMNYARIIPMVDYTAELVGKLLRQE
ncbi:heat-inducible transcriptional repressor HrcA [Aestuariispira insulae]|uniref:Heat-inducible transcription repressor HrcA n=1 Tax=Aestuariispira insulae TaxID=1461337 RepID=A0A3D9HPK7_9PROT|nr:heat-inducible transcriptional repressor HrcA [Aestuariispira insulae]RED51443.1 heat-inducible transcription repressor HrcA [Aestuariispira insulae]